MILASAQRGLTIQGNLARGYAHEVAEAASRGWITTQTEPTTHGRTWLLTTAGLAVLNIEKGLA